MSAEEREMAIALGRCRFVPATFAKRFAADISARAEANDPQISEREAGYLRSSVYTFRRQIPRDVVSLAGDVPQQRRDWRAQQGWRNATVSDAEGASALMSEGYRAPAAVPIQSDNLELFPTASFNDTNG